MADNSIFTNISVSYNCIGDILKYDTEIYLLLVLYFIKISWNMCFSLNANWYYILQNAKETGFLVFIWITIEQVLATTPYETPTIQTLAPHHENYTS